MQFLRSHDELDLGRLTDEQRQKTFDAFAPQKRMQLYDRGIRRRLAPMLANDGRRLRMAFSLLFSLPGTPMMAIRGRNRDRRRFAAAGAGVRTDTDAVDE